MGSSSHTVLPYAAGSVGAAICRQIGGCHLPVGRWFPVPWGMKGRTWRGAFKAPGTVARRAIWPVIGGRREALSESGRSLVFYARFSRLAAASGWRGRLTTGAGDRCHHPTASRCERFRRHRRDGSRPATPAERLPFVSLSLDRPDLPPFALPWLVVTTSPSFSPTQYSL